MRRPDDASFLLDMLVAARTAAGYIEGVTASAFYANAVLQDAVVRQVQILGEAASRLSGEFREAHQEIAWDEIIGMRHRLVHDYRQINRYIVWTTASKDLPALISVLEPLLAPPSQD